MTVCNHAWRRMAVAALVYLVGTGCDARLPEPDSAGARMYADRCSTCHRLYGPGLLTEEMWKLLVQRKQQNLARAGLPPLSAEEQAVLLAYLQRHSSTYAEERK